MTLQRIAVLTILMVASFGTRLHAATSVRCGAAFGAQFNLEPAANAVPQQFESVDFIPNGVGLNEDLVVGGALDFRGGRAIASLSGYYVHRSTTADCSPQLEGGLPSIVSNGATFNGGGGVAIAADTTRNAFFASDVRFAGTGNSMVTAIGLFRASSATLLNSTLCPNGTHTAAQSKSCWEATPAVLFDPQAANPNQTLDYPSIAVDERANGVGAGDVYVVYQRFNVNTGGNVLIACTNATSSCSAPKIISASGEAVAFLGTGNAQVQVRPDGDITVTYLDQGSAPAETVKFVLCKPAGAPKAPVCSAPVVVANENQTLGPGGAQSVSGLNLFVFTSARHADRLESDGKTVTTFVVWDRCNIYFQAPASGGEATCLNAQVLLSRSSDGGNTWSAPVPVNTSKGHQFLPAISTDESTGTVNIAYFNTAPDMFHKRIVVTLNQIAAGGTTIGAPIALTSVPMAWDADPRNNPLPLSFLDFHFGIKARGMGSAGHSRVFASFTSTADRPGIYNGSPLPEHNNNLQELTY